MVDALVAPAQQAEPVAARPARGRRAWSNRRPPGPSRNSGRGGSAASTAAKIGSGRITIPAPPPNGLSSTVRWTSVVCSRGSWVRRSSRPAARALPSRLAEQNASTTSGKMREDVDPHRRRPRQLEQAGRRVDRRSARRACSTTNTTGTSAPESSSSRSAAGLATTATHVPARACRRPRRRRRRSARGPTARRGRRAARRRPGRWCSAGRPSRSSTPSNVTSQRSWCGDGGDDGQPAVTGEPAGARREALGAVGGELRR